MTLNDITAKSLIDSQHQAARVSSITDVAEITVRRVPRLGIAET